MVLTAEYVTGRLQGARSRHNGKVLHKHVASFGYAPLPLIVPDRIQFWTRLHERLGLHARALETLMITRRSDVQRPLQRNPGKPRRAP